MTVSPVMNNTLATVDISKYCISVTDVLLVNSVDVSKYHTSVTNKCLSYKLSNAFIKNLLVNK